MNTIITGDESWMYRYDPEPVIFPYHENLTRALNTTSLKFCLPSTDTIDRWGKNSRIAYEGSSLPHGIALHEGFRKKKSQIVF
jgi:hypothetical protein